MPGVSPHIPPSVISAPSARPCQPEREAMCCWVARGRENVFPQNNGDDLMIWSGSHPPMARRTEIFPDILMRMLTQSIMPGLYRGNYSLG